MYEYLDIYRKIKSYFKENYSPNETNKQSEERLNNTFPDFDFKVKNDLYNFYADNFNQAVIIKNDMDLKHQYFELDSKKGQYVLKK